MTNTQPKMPSGISYIIGNELAERFSFYGMKTILVVFMTKYLLDSSGELATMSSSDAKYWYHLFVMFTYFTPIIGAIVADIFLGKYRTIMFLSVVYCLGHLALALDETRLGLTIGLTLIAMGSGGIKPCVSAHVGDQFDESNKTLVDKIFAWFYLSINVGSVVSTLLTPLLLEWYGPHIAFGIPGILMLIATIVFWMGRKSFIAIKPVGAKQYWADLTSPQGKKALLTLTPIYLVVAFFWSVFDQTGSALVLQADKMDRVITLFGGSFEVLPSQVQAANPLLVILFIPLFTFGIYPILARIFKLTALRKITIGMFICGLAFAVCAYVENLITMGQTPSIMWQIFAYVVLTASEIFVSITALEFAYTQAPNSLKSFIMSFYLLSVALGNFVTAMINGFNEKADGSLYLAGADYYWFFVGMTMVATVVLFIFSTQYKEEKYIQTADMIE